MWQKVTIARDLFHDRGPYNIETNTLICSPNKWTGFYVIGTFVRKEFTKHLPVQTLDV